MTRKPTGHRVSSQRHMTAQAAANERARMIVERMPSMGGIYDDGRLVNTGDRPADWYKATQAPGRGSDRG